MRGCVGWCSSSRGSPRRWRCAGSGEAGCQRWKPTRARLLERLAFGPCKPGLCLQQRCRAGKHPVRALNVAVNHIEHALCRAVQDDLILEDGHPKHVAAEVVARHVQVEVIVGLSTAKCSTKSSKTSIFATDGGVIRIPTKRLMFFLSLACVSRTASKTILTTREGTRISGGAVPPSRRWPGGDRPTGSRAGAGREQEEDNGGRRRGCSGGD